MSITILPVQSGSDLRTFIALPRRLYNGMAGFHAPLDRERRELLDPAKAAFYQHGQAQYWLARRDGQWVGRVSAQIDALATTTASGPPGMFGCLDAIDDQGVVTALLRTAEQWLRAKGCSSARGPFLLSINGETGLLLEGHAEPAMTLMPWHPAYLDGLVRAAGYMRVKTVLSFTLDFTDPDVAARLENFGLRQPPDGMTIRGLRMEALDAEGEIARNLFNDAWRGNWGFVPLVEADMRALIKGFKPLLFKDCAVVAEMAGEPAAVAMVVPNIFDLTAGIGAAPTPFGWLRLVARLWRARYRTARIILFGMATRYRSSVQGLAMLTLVIAELIRRGRALRLSSIEAGWVLDDNTQILRMLRSVGFRRTRVYGVYETALT